MGTMSSGYGVVQRRVLDELAAAVNPPVDHEKRKRHSETVRAEYERSMQAIGKTADVGSLKPAAGPMHRWVSLERLAGDGADAKRYESTRRAVATLAAAGVVETKRVHYEGRGRSLEVRLCDDASR
jgi:hypothetical protein